MSDTPRVDAVVIIVPTLWGLVVPESFARQLERELAEKTAQIEIEREACAKVCESEAKMYRSVGSHGAAGNLLNAASAIRGRSTNDGSKQT